MAARLISPGSAILLNEFQPPRAVYYSFGNHDLDLGSEKVHELLDPWLIEILENRLIEFGFTNYWP